MMKLRCPLHRKFLDGGEVCRLTQLFDEDLLDYSKGYHGGLDISTKGPYKYKWNNIVNDFIPEERTDLEKNGRVLIVAAHDGRLSMTLNSDKEGKGWGVFVTEDPIMVDADFPNVRYQTMYWHIETPWRSLASFRGFIPSLIQLTKMIVGKKVKRGSIIAVGGNSGFVSPKPTEENPFNGSHLHFELRKKTRSSKKATWTDWEPVDPLPYFDDQRVLYKRGFGDAEQNYYRGQKITKDQAEKIQKIFDETPAGDYINIDVNSLG